MKKFVIIIAFVIICLMTCTMLFGCRGNAATELVQETAPETLPTTKFTETTESEYAFAQVPSEGNEIEGYREEYKNRIATNTLKREEEIEFLESNGYFIYTEVGYFELRYFDEYNGMARTYSDPIVYQSNNGIEVWAINEDGGLCSITTEARGVYAFNEEDGSDTITYHGGEFYGLIHYTAQEGEEIIQSTEDCAISYEPETGMVKHWEYGELIGQAEVPENSIYVGCNSYEGYLFKDGTDVWAVRSVYEGDKRTRDSEIIAHNVAFVITSQYHASFNEYLPLFLMTDGTLKTYVYYEGDYDDPMDDESHLMDIQYEGGYV